MYFKFVWADKEGTLQHFIVEASKGRYTTQHIDAAEAVIPFEQMGEPRSDEGDYVRVHIRVNDRPTEFPALAICLQIDETIAGQHKRIGYWAYTQPSFGGGDCTLYIMSDAGKTIDKMRIVHPHRSAAKKAVA